MKSTSLSRYAYIQSFYAPANFGVLSVARLAPSDAGLDRVQVADVTQLRVYKLMLKSIGRMAGLRGDGCVLKLSRSVAELDAKSAEFCLHDWAALMAVKRLKENPSGSCSTVLAAR